MLDIGTVEEPPGPGAFRLELCPNNSRDEATQVPLLQKNVEQQFILTNGGHIEISKDMVTII